MRDNSVSIAKGIAILLMVLVHGGFYDIGSRCIGIFHMPLFFFFAGYCFKEKYLLAPFQFVKKRVTGLYLPCIKWGLLFLLLHNVFFHLNLYNGEYGFNGTVSELYSIKDFVVHAAKLIVSMNGFEQLLGGYWFLHSLFVASLTAYVIIRVCGKSRLWIGGVGLLLGATLFDFMGWHIPIYGGQKEFLGTIFFLIGYAYHLHERPSSRMHRWQFLIGTVLVILGAMFWRSSMLTVTGPKMIPYIASAVGGTLATFAVSHWIDARADGRIRRALVYIGDNTFTILTWHFLSFKLVSLLIIFIYGLPVAQLAYFPVIGTYAHRGWWLAYFVAGIAIPMFLSRNKYTR